jgi:hypothetical protein
MIKYVELVRKKNSSLKNVTKNKKEKCATVQRVGWCMGKFIAEMGERRGVGAK